MTHVNEITFEGETPWVKAMNEAGIYWRNYCNDRLSNEEQDRNFYLWQNIRYELKTGKYGN